MNNLDLISIGFLKKIQFIHEIQQCAAFRIDEIDLLLDM